jgi:hypothetical protein
MSRVATSLDSLSEFVEKNVGEFTDGNDKIIALTEAGLDISRDFPEAEGGTNMRTSVLELLTQLDENKTSQEELIATTRSLPRMTTEFNRAKRRAVNAQELMLGEIERLRQSLSASLDHFDSTDGAA